MKVVVGTGCFVSCWCKIPFLKKCFLSLSSIQTENWFPRPKMLLLQFGDFLKDSIIFQWSISQFSLAFSGLIPQTRPTSVARSLSEKAFSAGWDLEAPCSNGTESFEFLLHTRQTRSASRVSKLSRLLIRLSFQMSWFDLQNQRGAKLQNKVVECLRRVGCESCVVDND